MSKTVIVASIRSKTQLKFMAALTSALLLLGCGAGTATLRANNGDQLAPCDSGPHCVSSETSNKDRHVAPIPYSGSRTIALLRLEEIINGMEGAKIIKQAPNYIHVTYTSAVFGFVDDVEFLLPADSHEIQLRSSSRLGYYDFGVNRARVETIRNRFEAPVG